MLIFLKKISTAVLYLHFSLASILLLLTSTAEAIEKDISKDETTICVGRIFALMPSQVEPASPIKIYVKDLPKKARFYIDKGKRFCYAY